MTYLKGAGKTALRPSPELLARCGLRLKFASAEARLAKGEAEEARGAFGRLATACAGDLQLRAQRYACLCPEIEK
jgi:hypothetical protein